ncbi:MAG: hypoxanthine phosphoribosyltransferase [Candidatus Neomarinimicrobiota bacterium]|nr:MAG: hypoxanthine phosphoribosyltransferase [Candidatus Neomarinimicrobiota bacterium]
MTKTKVLDDTYGKYSGMTLHEMISYDKIQKRIKEMAADISEDYRGKSPIMIGVLNGSFIFFADLIREMDITAEVDFIKISSYANETRTSGTVRLLKDISCDITGRDIIVVEDIVDSGLSIDFLKRRLQDSQASSVKFASLLIKEYTKLDFDIDYVGFKIPDKFVVGYGLDLAQKMRNLKSIYYLNQEGL